MFHIEVYIKYIKVVVRMNARNMKFQNFVYVSYCLFY